MAGSGALDLLQAPLASLDRFLLLSDFGPARPDGAGIGSLPTGTFAGLIAVVII
jgi:hypothetical protein